MGNTGLLRREAEMTLLQPHLGEMRRQELRNSSFWPSSLFKSQLVKEGEDFLLKKGTSKDSQGFGPYQNTPFRGPHNKKRGSYRKRPYGGNSSQSSNQSFSSGRGNRISEAPGVVVDPTIGHQWLHTAISLKTKLGQISSDYIRIQGPSKRPSSDRLYPVCSVKERNRKGGKCKISGFYSHRFLVPKPHQRWRPVIDLSRLNTFVHVEKFKMETPESIRTCLIPGEWVLSINLSDAYLHIPIHPYSRKYLRFCHKSQVFQFTSLPFGLATAPQVFTMIVKEVKLMALSRGLKLHQYLDDWLIRSQSQEEAQVNTQAVVDLTQSLGWIINQEK